MPAQTLTLSRSYTRTAPGNTGGLVATWTSSDLPAGLSINSATGAISGLPTALQTATDSHITATNSGGTQTITISFTVNEVIPDLGTYADMVLVLGNSITPISPTSNAGGEISRWTSSDLPSGLVIDSLTGVISGTPDTLQAASLAHITAENSGGMDTATISFAVNAVAPALGALSNQTFTKGIAIAGVPAPSNAGGPVVTWSSDDLPNGLSINSSTGEITGTPTDLQTATTSTITATNTGGSGTTTIVITVVDVAPSLTAHAAIRITKGVPMTTIVAATNTGGQIVTWSSGNIPDGLSLDPTTGEISGTPTTIRTADMYVTGTNTGGQDIVAVNIAVVDVAPTITGTYGSNSTQFTITTPFNAIEAPAHTGQNLTWSARGLPSGVEIDSQTGAISGTPDTLTNPTNAEITVSNSGGSASTTFYFQVNDFRPQLGLYTQDYSVTLGDSVTIPAPSNGGGAATSWSLAPGEVLPDGLSIDPTTGVISGTTTRMTAAQPYIVQAHNSGGSHGSSVRIAVVDRLPAFGPVQSQTFTRYSAITPIDLAPLNTGGEVLDWTSMGLPNGIRIDRVTGVLSGTPSDSQSSTTTTIYAENSGGITTFTIDIVINDVPPLVTADLGSRSVTQYEPFYRDLVETAVLMNSGHITQWTATGLPDGLTIDASTGVISGITTSDQATTATITASNNQGSVQSILSFVILPVVAPIMAQNIPAQAYTIGQSYTLTISNSSSPAHNWSNIGLPSFCGLYGANDGLSAIVECSPVAEMSAQTVVVTGTNRAGSDSSTFTIAAVQPLPNLVHSPASSMRLNRPVSEFPLANTGGPIASWDATNLPPGISINPSTGVLTGSPTSLGRYDVMYTATNSGGSVTETQVFIVIDNEIMLQQVDNQFYTINEPIAPIDPRVNISGGAVTRWMVSGLPSGLTFDPTTGVISGTPDQTTYVEHVVISASNSGCDGISCGTVMFSITVGSVPVLASINDVVINARSFYEMTIPNSGGDVSRWTISAGSLPTGLSIDANTGRIAGTATRDGQYSVVVRGTNFSGFDEVPINFFVDTAAPTIQSARVNSHGTGLVVIFTEAMGNTVGLNSTFVVKVNNVSNNVTSVSVASTGVTLDLATTITAGQTVTLSFGASSLQDAQGVAAAAVSNFLVTNLLVILSYPTSNLCVGSTTTMCTQMLSPMSALNPTALGFATNPSFSVSPALPSGLTLNEITGVISGTPTARVADTNYRVTAIRNTQVATFDIHLKVIYTPTRPTNGSTGVSINNAATWTNTTAVTLNIVWPQGTSYVQVSNDGGMTTSTNFDVAAAIPWTLDSSQSASAQRSVYVRFLDNEGADLAQNSSAFTDDIELDNVVPTITTVTAAANAAGLVTVTYAVTDNAGGSGIQNVQVADTEDAAALANVPLAGVGTASANGKAAIQDAIGTAIFLRVRDFAGNYSGWTSKTITLPPPPPASQGGDNATSGEVTDNTTITTPTGTAKLPDGSAVGISANGTIMPYLSSGYIGLITGDVTMTYINSTTNAKATWKCKYAQFGITKKNPKLKISPKTKWWPVQKATPKVGCKMPAAVFASSKLKPFSLALTFTFKRLWPTTALPFNPIKKKKILPIKRTIRVKIAVKTIT